MTQEEVDLDLSLSDQDSPLLWLRLDPDCNLIRTCRLRQPDYCLQYMVRFERDVIGQMEALNQLPDYPTENTVKALKETIESLDYFWRVRCAGRGFTLYTGRSSHTGQNSWLGLYLYFIRFSCLKPEKNSQKVLQLYI